MEAVAVIHGTSVWWILQFHWSWELTHSWFWFYLYQPSLCKLVQSPLTNKQLKVSIKCYNLFNILILLCVHLVAACLCCWAVVGHFTLGFSFQYKLSFTSCEHLGKSMRSSITQYMYISDMQWNQSCLLARRVLSHKIRKISKLENLHPLCCTH